MKVENNYLPYTKILLQKMPGKRSKSTSKAQKKTLNLEEPHRVQVVEFIKDREEDLFRSISPSWSKFDHDSAWRKVFEYW